MVSKILKGTTLALALLMSGCSVSSTPKTSDNIIDLIALQGRTIYLSLVTQTVDDVAIDEVDEGVATDEALGKIIKEEALYAVEDDTTTDDTVTQSDYRFKTFPTHGEATLNGNTLSYTPESDYTGSDLVELEYGDELLTPDTYQITRVYITVKDINEAPTIEGIPTTIIAEGDSYSFIPTANDEDNNMLTFKIANKPVWCDFNSSTGELNGTASLDGGLDDGEGNSLFSDVTISVTDGIESVSLDPFDITVIGS